VTSPRPIVNSWDVFDTLLTRFVPDPMSVFRLIDRRHPGFYEARLAAQAALDRIGKPYILHDIYAAMEDAGMDRATARKILAEELETERGLMFPIRAAVERVGPHDLIISDMYLSTEQIAGLVADICDLHARYPIIRSNWGKHSGTIWPKILQHYILRAHHGDNPNADVAVPQKFGIKTVLLRDTDLSAWEKSLAEAGLTQLAYIQRETRLRSLAGPPDMFAALACGPYLTLLLACAHYLQTSFGDDTVFGFLSRDCDDLARVFRAVHPAVRALNVDLSRRLARDPTTDEVFGEILPENCVLVDILSTGRSVGAFLERQGRPGLAFTTILWLDHLLKTEDAPGFAYLHKSSEFGGNHYPLEFLLQAPYPPVTGLSHDAASGGLIRSFGPNELLDEERRKIALKSEIVTNFLRAIRTRGLAPLTGAQSQVLIKHSLDVILRANPIDSQFPSFIARETHGPF
jgi:hypothetical protein